MKNSSLFDFICTLLDIVLFYNIILNYFFNKIHLLIKSIKSDIKLITISIYLINMVNQIFLSKMLESKRNFFTDNLRVLIGLDCDTYIAILDTIDVID